jgi:hypothetical protein
LQKLLNKEEPTPNPVQKPTTTTHQSPSLIIVDPLNKYNNIGKSSYNFTGIQ